MSKSESAETRGWVRNLARWLVSGYYPSVTITGADRIPQSGPVLLSANHPNSLLDPVLIGTAARRPVRFMAKAPLFDHPLLGPPMKAVGMVPVFRGADDSRAVRRNFESLDVGAKVLVDGHAMGIFPEGKSSDGEHLETVRSGAARMAIQAAEEGTQGVLVVPIGICYERKESFRTAVWLRVGEPIDVDACLTENEGDGRKARRALTQKLENRLKGLVIHLDEAKWEAWLDDLETLAVAPADRAKSGAQRLAQRKQIADAMNHFLANDRERAEAVAGRIEAYRNHVRSAGLRMNSPVLRLRGLQVWLTLLGRFLYLSLLLVPAILGTIFHLIPFMVVRFIAARLDGSGRMAVATYRLLVGVPIHLIWYVVAGLLIASQFAPWIAVASLIAAPFLGVLGVHYCRHAGRAARLLWHQICVTLRRGDLKRLARNKLKSGREFKNWRRNTWRVRLHPSREKSSN